MIEYNHKQRRDRNHTVVSGEGKISNPCDVCFLIATGRELEIILETAPFLVESKGKRTIQTFTECEASAAALAFNFTEK